MRVCVKRKPRGARKRGRKKKERAGQRKVRIREREKKNAISFLPFTTVSQKDSPCHVFLNQAYPVDWNAFHIICRAESSNRAGYVCGALDLS